MQNWDVIVVGAGAAGLMCAIEAGKRGRKVLIVDHAKQIGQKIRISGGGRCNFTNYNIEPDNYLCQNPHFCKSALSRYSQWDFIALMDSYQIPWHEREHTQLFCDNSAKDIVAMLQNECTEAGVEFLLRTEINSVQKAATGFVIESPQKQLQCKSLVIATGGLSMPKLGATPFGLKLAKQFGLKVLPTRAGLVPFTLQPELKQKIAQLSGISITVVATAQCGKSFKEQLLFTHRGLSGPAILQISSYWQEGESVELDLLPNTQVLDFIEATKQKQPKLSLKNALTQKLPKRFIELLIEDFALPDKALNQLSHKELEQIAQSIHHWQVQPGGTEGYRTAEVTLGGVNTDELSSKTMEAKKVKGLYFIGEVMDLTGHLGGYNFQWAWSSGWAAGQVV